MVVRARGFITSLSAVWRVILPPIGLALSTLLHVLRNSLLCVAVGWLFGYCFTVGNLFSGLPAGQQSYPEFSAANIAWFYGVFSGCMIVLTATKLLPEKFVACTFLQIAELGANKFVGQKLNLLQCFVKILRRMTVHIVVSSAIVVGGDYTLYASAPASWRKYKPCVYIAAFWGLYIMVIADMLVRHIFKTETVRGLAARDLGGRETLKRNAPTYCIAAVSFRDKWLWMPPPRQFARIYARNLPVMIFVVIAIVYVHVMSQFVNLQGQWELFGFAGASIMLKLSLQEIAKYLLTVSRRSLSRRAMVVLVSTPTIIVDTQVRMILLRIANSSVSVVGTVLLSAFEIAVRAVKSLIVQRQTRGPAFTWSMSRRSTFGSSPPAFRSGHHVKVSQVAAKPESVKIPGSGAAALLRVDSKDETAAQYKARRRAEERRRKRRVLHAAEIYADMYAEYLAIGCSYAIWFFFRRHPQYHFSLLLSNKEIEDGDGSGSVKEDRTLAIGGLQLVIEVVVDLMACAIEAAEGVEFQSFDQRDPFLVFFLAVLAFANVAISAGLYIH